jgi:hypothetical protein
MGGWWGMSDGQAHDGVDCAWGTALSWLDPACIQTTIEGPRALSYWCTYSEPESGTTWMALKIDGAYAGAVYSTGSGATGWAYQRYVIPAGTHTVRWEIGGIAAIMARLDEVSFSAPEAELYVNGGAVAISSGDNTASTSDGTDFGSVQLGRNVSRYFTLGNRGTRDLTIQSVQVGGVSTDGFTVGTCPSVIQPGDFYSLGVHFSPIRLGARNALLTITSDDPHAGSYTFAIAGTGAAGVNPDDVDNDNIPDAWELARGLDATTHNRPAQDTDHDGVPDIHEYVADTDPTNELSSLPGVAFVPGAGVGDLAVSVSLTSTARVYGAQRAVYLAATGSPWSACAPEVTGSGSIVSFPITATDSQGVYRVRIRVP